MNLLVNATCLDKKVNTGIERYAYHLCKEISKIDNSLTFYSSFSIPGVRNVKISTLLNATKNLLGNYEYYVRTVWDQIIFRFFVSRRKPDVVFFPIQDGMIYPKIKQIITVHDLHYFHFNDSVTECRQEISAIRRFFYRYKMPHILKRSCAIVAVSEATKLDIIDSFGISPEKIHVVYNGYDSERFHEAINPIPVLKRLDLAGTKYFLFVGSILRHKNIVRLVQSLACLDPCTSLVIAGVCKDSAYLEEIMSASAELRSGRVRYLEYVANDDLPSLYQGAEALVLPSLHEGFGVPIIEAMACGTPVITSNCSAMPEVAGDAAILVNPFRVESISDAMNEILENPLTAQKLKTAGLARAATFSWENSANKLYQLCQKVHDLNTIV